MNINEIKELLLVIDKTNLEYVKLEGNDIRLEVSKNNNSINTIASTMEVQTTNFEKDTREDNNIIQTNDNSSEDYIVVTAPLMGTYYESSSPESESFVKLGDIVQEGDTLCILEAMKLMNEISSEVKGEIVEVLVKNEALVEYNQPLFKIKPI
ncbi:MAG: acetyl-CoA carboxylase biotin carboxyl carrier protein [Peptostreptococcaceae bacterium]